MIVKNGNIIKFASELNESLTNIPVGNWLLKYNDFAGEYYLEKQEPFKLPSKIYGDLESQSSRYLNTFKKRSGNTGVLLTGKKGSGKSVIAKKVCIDSNLPVILITTPFNGTAFESFLSNINQEVIIFIDEFEKVYDKTNTQDSLLTILDGVFSSKKLFLFTINYINNINDALLNRPGRIFYLKEYEGLDKKQINEIIDDLLINKKNKNNLLKSIAIIGNITMDSLTSLIWEMNEYNINSSEALENLNIKIEDLDFNIEYKTTLSNNKEYIFTGFTDEHPLDELSSLSFLLKNNVDIEELVSENIDIRMEEAVSRYITLDLFENKYEVFNDGTIKFDYKGDEIVFKPKKNYKLIY